MIRQSEKCWRVEARPESTGWLIYTAQAAIVQQNCLRPPPERLAVMSYPLLVALHLFAAIIFVGTVFFEVLILEGIRKPVGREVMRKVEIAIGRRARRVMPFAIFILYAAGIAMAWQYREQLAHPFDSSFGTLLTIKIILAISVLAHFLTAITASALGKLKSRHFKWIHLSVFTQVILIVALAKAMFNVTW